MSEAGTDRDGRVPGVGEDGRAKVNNLQSQVGRLGNQQHVLGLQVGMNYALAVYVGNGLQHLERHASDLIEGEAALSPPLPPPLHLGVETLAQHLERHARVQVVLKIAKEEHRPMLALCVCVCEPFGAFPVSTPSSQISPRSA